MMRPLCRLCAKARAAGGMRDLSIGVEPEANTHGFSFEAPIVENDPIAVRRDVIQNERRRDSRCQPQPPVVFDLVAPVENALRAVAVQRRGLIVESE